MGTNNRQRRAAKARRRGARRHQQQPRAEEHGDGFAAEAELALRELVVRRARGIRSALDMDPFRRHPEQWRRRAVAGLMGALVRNALADGWGVTDLHQVARRKVDSRIRNVVQSVVADEDDRGSAHAERLRARAALQLPWASAEPLLIDLLVTLAVLPPLAADSTAGTRAADAPGVDERVLRKVRALLSKAEATQFEHEADALTAKAQQLMTSYSIERALAEPAESGAHAPTARRIWLDAPYVDAKSMLVDAVAGSNHCASVLTTGWGFVTLVGHPGDLDAVELLSTSLLVQATRALTAVGSQVARDGRSRTRSFRRSFLIAYAGRIGERLRESATEAEALADTEHGGALVPVLAARDDAVHETFTTMFPDLVRRSVTVSNTRGWGAGRAAADLADLDVRRGVASAPRAG